MLLKDLGTDSQTKIGKINKFLSAKYGIKISESTDLRYLQSLKKEVSAKIQKLRVTEGLTPKDPRLVKEILVLEGIDTIIEYRATAHQEIAHGPYRRVLDNLSDDAIEAIQIGDSYEDALETVMKAYRSSIYRFNDDMVKADLENRIREYLRTEYEALTSQEVSGSDPIIGEAATASVVDEAPSEEDGLTKDVKAKALKRIIAELISWSTDLRSPVSQTWAHHSKTIIGDAVGPMIKQNADLPVNWDAVSRDLVNFISNKFDSAEYDLGPDDLETMELDEVDYSDLQLQKQHGKDRHMKDIDAPNWSMADAPAKKSDDDGVVTFAHPSLKKQPSKIKKEDKHMTAESKENYIKRLRTILENEVVQAEVLVAAKSFGQEIQVMIEKIGRLTNEDLGPVVDQMRGAFGTQEAASFQESMRSEMEAVLQNLRSVKEKIDDSVEKLASGGVPGMETDMDADIGMDAEPGMDTGMDAGMEPVETDLDAETDGEFQDEFGGVEDEPLGRPAKESVEALQAQLKKLREQIEAKKRKK